MRWFSDRAGFPMVELPNLALAVHLLPVTKHQFERFLADPGPFGDSWYEEILTVSPRVALSEPEPEQLESFFLTGIQPAEIAPFAKWLGTKFEMPAAEKWRLIDLALSEETVQDSDREMLQNDKSLCAAARRILVCHFESRKPQTWGQLALLHGGLLEWVKSGPTTFGGLGVPRPEFHTLIANPHRDSPVRPIDSAKRYRYFGFRLIRPI